MECANNNLKTVILKLRQLDVLHQSWSFGMTSVVVLSFIMFVFVSNAWADSRRVDQFTYDASGSIVGKSSQVFTLPPVVTNLSPNFINRGESINAVAVGTDLLGLQISTSDPEISISNIQSTITSLNFTLSASPQATLGATTLTFFTSLGSDVQIFTVFEEVPSIVTEPNPISITADNKPNTIVLHVEARAADQIYNLSVTDTSFAQLTLSSITIPANETTTTFDIVGLALGNTELTISANNSNFSFTSSFPVFVTERLSGNIFDTSLDVGVVVGTKKSTDITTGILLPSADVGLVVGSKKSTDITTGILLPSADVGLIVGNKTSTDIVTNVLLPSVDVGLIVGNKKSTDIITGILLPGADVGLVVGSNKSTDIVTNALLIAPLTGTLVGPNLLRVEPSTLSLGSTTELLITGVNLLTVDNVVITPSAGITLGAFSIDAKGRNITVPITIDALAVPSLYVITASTPTGTVPSNLALTVQ